MKNENTYIVAAVKPWNRKLFHDVISHYPGTWRFAGSNAELERLLETDPAPRAIFFLHWNDMIPERIFAAHECVVFHMTDVPFGRGGSPLQNLIARGISQTMLSALRVTAQLDAGPVYTKRPLCLGGAAEEIFIRCSRLAAEIILELSRDWTEPFPQQGDVTLFSRRVPAQSRIERDDGDLAALHDFIRMLDADGYPRAFLEYGGYRLEFSRSALRDGHLLADVRVTSVTEDDA